MSRGGDFWARRRAGVAAEAEAEEAARAGQALAEEQAAYADMSEAEVLEALDLPDPDTLVQGDDFSMFMAKSVPDMIRRRALRALWRSNPVLANVDMLVDYGEDFTDSAMVVENMQTAYQVGKGMMKHIEEMARQADAAEAPAEMNPSEEETPVEEEVQVAASEEDAAEVDEAPAPSSEPAPEAEDIAHAAPAPRRMRFRVEETA